MFITYVTGSLLLSFEFNIFIDLFHFTVSVFTGLLECFDYLNMQLKVIQYFLIFLSFYFKSIHMS